MLRSVRLTARGSIRDRKYSRYFRTEKRRFHSTLANVLLRRAVLMRRSTSCSFPASRSSWAIFRVISFSVRLRQIDHPMKVRPVSGKMVTKRIHHCEAARKADCALLVVNSGEKSSWLNRFVPSMPCVLLMHGLLQIEGSCLHR